MNKKQTLNKRKKTQHNILPSIKYTAHVKIQHANQIQTFNRCRVKLKFKVHPNDFPNLNIK